MDIKMTRGDTFPFKFQRLDADGNPILIPANRIYFTVKNKVTDTDYIFQKTIDDITIDELGWNHIVIEPEDTDNLDFDNYVYDIEVITDDYKQTIAQGYLMIGKEVTYKGNE